MKTKMVVFDLFGTLIHVRKKTSPYRTVLKALPTNKQREFVIALLCGHSFEATKQFNLDLRTELDSTELFPESISVLQKLRELGCKTGLISNLTAPYKEPVYRLGLGGIIDYKVFSCDIGCTKPYRRIYEAMRQKSNIDFGEMLMVGDSLKCDVIGPKSVGMNAILLDRYGTSKETNSIKTLNEILAIL